MANVELDYPNTQNIEKKLKEDIKKYTPIDPVTKFIFGTVSIGGKQAIKIINDFLSENKNASNMIINGTYNYWTSPLSYAIFLREEEVALYLIDLGFDVNYIDSIGNSPLNYAVANFEYEKFSKTEKRQNKELFEVVKKLLYKKANVFHKNTSNDVYPVYEALLNSYINSYELIKKK